MSDRDLRELERKASCGDEHAQFMLERARSRVPKCAVRGHMGPWVPIVIRTPEQIAEQERKAREAAPYLATSLQRLMGKMTIDFAHSPTHEMCEECGASRPYFRIYGRWMGNPILQPKHIFNTITVTP